MECVEHQQRARQARGGDRADLGIVEQVDQRLHVVAAEHGAEQFGGLFARDQCARRGALGDLGEEGGLGFRGVVHAGRNAMDDQFDQRLLFAFGRVLQQADQFLGLFLRKGQRRNAKRGALGDMLTVCL